MRRLGRWVLRTVVGLLLLVALVVLAVLLAVRTGPGEAALRDRVTRLLADVTHARVAIGRIGGSLIRTIHVDDLVLRFAGGTELRVARLRATMSPLSLLRGLVLVDEIAVDGVRVRAVHTADGWGLPDVPDEDDTHESRPLPHVVLRSVRIADGRVAVAIRDAEPARVFAATSLALDAGVRLGPDGIRLDLAALTLVPRGIDLSPLTARGTVRLLPDGSIALDDVAASTARSYLDVDGVVTTGQRVDVDLRALGLAAREVRAVLPGLDLASDALVTGRATGPWDAVAVQADVEVGTGGRATAHGELDLAATPPRWSATATLVGVDPAAILPSLPPAGIHATLSGQGAGATLSARVVLDESIIAGQHVQRGIVDAALADGVANAGGRLALAAGVASVRARAALGETIGYRARVRADVTDLAAVPGAPPGTAAARATVRGTEPASGRREVTLAAHIDRATVHGVALSGGALAARLDGLRLHLDRLQVHGPGTDLTAWADVDLDSRRAEATADATVALDVVGRQAALPAGGTATVRARATGTLDALTFDARAVVEQARWEATDARRIEAVAHASDLGGPGATARVTVAADAVHPPGRDPWDVAVELDWKRPASTDEAVLRASGRSTGGAAARVALSAQRTAASTVARITEIVVAPAKEASWQLARPARVTVADAIAIDELTLESGAQRVTLAGHAGLSGAADATLRASSVRLASLCALLLPKPAAGPKCGGTLTADARLTGTAAAPSLTATAAVDALRVDDTVYGPLTASARYAERALAVQARLAYPDAGTLEVDGTLPFDLAWAGTRRDLSSAPVSVAIRAQRFDLRVLRVIAPTAIRRSEGSMTADLRLTGPLDGLRASGRVDVEGRRLELVATGVPYEDLRLRLRAAESSLVVEELAAHAGGGTLTGSGSIALAGLRPGTADVRVRLARFLAVKLPAYEAEVDGELTIDGAVTAPAVRGRIDVTRALVRPSVLPSSNPSRQPDPTIEVVGLPPAPPEPEPAGPGVAEALALGIDVHIRDNVWIRRDDASIELAGDLRVDKAPDGPVLISGTVRLVRGWYAFQRRRFELEEGLITFTGSSPPDPSFDIRASYRTGEYRVIVEIGGSADKPTLTLSSEPPLDQADVLSVLLFGRPSSQLGKGESFDLQQQAVSLAAGYVMPELRSSVMDAFGLDTLELGDTGVSAGRYVAQDVFVSLSQEFGPQQGQAVGVEYGFTPSISLKLSTSTRGDSAVDLLWHRRY